jgi:hypothetical protein
MFYAVSTRASSQRQLPTDHDCAVPTRVYQSDQPSLPAPQSPPALLPKQKGRRLDKTSKSRPKPSAPLRA